MKLPGKAAHLKMAPPFRVESMTAETCSPEGARKSAVLVLLLPPSSEASQGKNAITQKEASLLEWNVVLLKRKDYKGIHSGQISFPGGKCEEIDGGSYTCTALREAFEELGIRKNQITLVGELSRIYVPPSNFDIFPVIALGKQRLQFVPDPREVADYRLIPLTKFNPATAEMREVEVVPGRCSVVPGFNAGNYFIWGATAMILSEVFELVVTGEIRES